MEAFVYCWTDKLTNKLYVGSHKGSIDDGYICSSKYMLEEYNKRPNDFTREIIAHGLIKEMRKLEFDILKSVNAALNEQFYNMHNGDGDFILLYHRNETKEKMRNARLGKKRSLKSIEKQKNSITGNKNHFYGKTHTDEFKKRQSERQKINQFGGLNNNSVKVKYKNDIFGTIKELCSATNLSYHIIKKMISNNEVEIVNG